MYTQSITRSHRTAFILAIDQSGSMAEKLLFRGRQTTKAEAVAEVTNRLLFELIERARRSDEVRDYYDIAVLGYSGDGIVSLLNDPEPLVPVSRLAALPVDFAETVVERRMPDGEATFRKISMPAWIAPKAVGQTPMYEALLQIRDLTQAWCTNPAHSESFPPIVFNITDGEASDCDQREQLAICEKIRTIGTTDGKVLLINIHIATTSDSRSLLFPTEEEIPADNRYARLLHDCSSPMPEELSEAIRQVRGDLRKDPHHRNHRRQGAPDQHPYRHHVRLTFAALSDRRGDSRRQPLRKTAARLFESDARRAFGGDPTGAGRSGQATLPRNELQHVDRRTHRHPQHRLDQHQNTVKR